MKHVVLASNSPQRKDLLSLLGWPFEISPADVDESRQPGEEPEPYVRRLACQKALAAAAQNEGLIIAADTIVVDGDLLMGKPGDEADARRMLTQLRGRTHQVYTGIALIDTVTGQSYDDVCCTNVPMRQYSDLEIETYIATGDPMDKAGAYAIQHPGFHPVEGLTGCYASVMGLPLCHLVVGLRKFDMDIPVDLGDKCQSLLNYACPRLNEIMGKG